MDNYYPRFSYFAVPMRIVWEDFYFFLSGEDDEPYYDVWG